MNPKYKTKQYELFEPVKVFIALMLVALYFFLPKAEPNIQQPQTPIQEVSQKLLPAIPNAGAQCASSCQRSVCVDWDPTPCGSHTWDIGCCLAYDTVCDPGCSEDPGDGGSGGPSYSPPTILHTFNCSDSLIG
ncbi:MAG: hypothetical protein H6634_04030 [Anaerolineales bacterium]|nr:hypothetical protein [Anaerolineales bacterium]